MGVVGNAEKVSQDLTETINSGFLQYNVVETYQVLTDNREDPPAIALTAPGLPAIGQIAIVNGTTFSTAVAVKLFSITSVSCLISCSFI